jgi:hypothetical protein
MEKILTIIGYVLFALILMGLTLKALRCTKHDEKTPEHDCTRKKLDPGNFCIVKHEGKDKRGKISYRSHNGRLKIRLAANHYIWRWERDVWPTK